MQGKDPGFMPDIVIDGPNGRTLIEVKTSATGRRYLARNVRKYDPAELQAEVARQRQFVRSKALELTREALNERYHIIIADDLAQARSIEGIKPRAQSAYLHRLRGAKPNETTKPG